MIVHAENGPGPGERAGGGTQPETPHIRQLLFDGGGSPVRRYMAVQGVSGWGDLLLHELVTGLLGHLPGALGLALRRLAYPLLFRRVGKGVVFGRGLVFRHARKITLGDRVVLGDGVVLDGRAGEGIALGDEVVVNRGAALHAKDGPIRVGARTDIGAGSTLNSPGLLELGRGVSIGGDCHLGGRSVGLEAPPGGAETDGPRRYSQGGVRVGDRCFLGGGVHVLDGVGLGEDCIVGAGLVVREDVAAGHAVLPRDRPIVAPRTAFSASGPEPAAVAGLDPSGGAGTDPSGGGPDPGDGDAPALDPTGANGMRERSERIVMRAMRRLNEQLPPDRRLRLEPDALLVRPDGPLDSLGVVNLVVTIEEEAERDLGRHVELFDAARVAEGDVPFSTAASLVRHLHAAVEAPAGGTG